MVKFPCLYIAVNRYVQVLATTQINDTDNRPTDFWFVLSDMLSLNNNLIHKMFSDSIGKVIMVGVINDFKVE